MPDLSTSRARPSRRLAGLVALGLVAHAPARAGALTLDEAIRATWRGNPGLAAGAAQVEAAQASADAARAGHLPVLALQARGVRTDEPVAAFGLKLDQARIAPADFSPASLNHPAAVGGVGLAASVALPLYAGGRVVAGSRAAGDLAAAEARSQERRRQEMALSVVEAYFGSRVAGQGVRYAEEVLAQARETEGFVRSRNAQGLALDADVARMAAFRAQSEAEAATARQRLASARSALALLAGAEAAGAELSTALEAPPATPAAAPSPAGRPDLEAARLQADAADAGVAVARGSLLPEVFAMASAETMRSSADQGARWTTLGLVARWQLSAGDAGGYRAAQARARAAGEAVRWQEAQARREEAEARRAVEVADALLASAGEAVAASESARALRLARHRQGLLPLTEVLDAEAGLAGARTLLLKARLDARVARARLQLALGLPIEGVTP